MTLHLESTQLKTRAFEHRRQTLLSELLHSQAELHHKLARSYEQPEAYPTEAVREITVGLEVNDRFMDVVKEAFNPFTCNIAGDVS